MHPQVQQPQVNLDINAELIRDRELLRLQYADLEQKYNIDIEELKINFLSESTRILV
jgi:hypothetical protein